jgi:hypothetical protein
MAFGNNEMVPAPQSRDRRSRGIKVQVGHNEFHELRRARHSRAGGNPGCGLRVSGFHCRLSCP